MTKKNATALLEGYAFIMAREYVKAQNGGELPAVMNGREVSVAAFREYIENSTDIKTNVGEMLADYITSAKPFAYESRKALAEEKRASNAAAEAKILSALGL